jgi:hypothetical protein
MACETELEPAGVDCPRCGAELAQAEYTRYVQSDTVGEPVGMVAESVLGRWKECVECGWIDTHLQCLPDGARHDFYESWA